MTYQLQLRIDDQWTTACFGEKPLALVEYAKVAKRLKNGELAGAPKPCRKQSPGVRHARDLAKDAAEHIKKTGQKTIYVYPLGNTGSHASNQFRKYLFGELTDHVAQWWTDVDRVKSEAIATKEMGYTIIEIDPEVYS